MDTHTAEINFFS